MEQITWEIKNSPYKSDFLQQTRTFGDKKPIYLIDQYAGKRPLLFNNDFKNNGTIRIEMRPSAILDSNVIDTLDYFIQSGKLPDGFKDFLIFLTEKNWDFNPFFYYIEHYSKSPQHFRENAIRRTESLLKIHTMNEKTFLKTGTIVPDLNAEEYYFNRTGMNSILEVATLRVDDFINGQDITLYRNFIKLTEIALIKMILIRKKEFIHCSPLKQYEEFKSFINNNLHITLGRETHLALHYFCDRDDCRVGRFLGIQSSTQYEKAISIISSTAWDIHLLRMPEALFSTSQTQIFVAYIATQEKKLHELARLYTIERIQNYGSAGFNTLVSFDLSGIPGEICEKLPIELIKFKKKRSMGNVNLIHQSLIKKLQQFCA